MSGNARAGETRSALRRHYLLHTPDAFVRTAIPGVTSGVVVVHASPELGADFLQYTAELQADGTLEPVAEQRFVWVLEGEISVVLYGRGRRLLGPGCYIYVPSGADEWITATTPARLAVIEKRYRPVPGFSPPEAIVGDEHDLEPVALNGDPGLLVRSLLPADLGFDFAVNTMTYAPDAALSQVEIHVMEHGLVMLEGTGTYRLGDDFHQVERDDFIWMAPFCPQWFRANPSGQAKYLIYKDWNRRPKL